MVIFTQHQYACALITRNIEDAGHEIRFSSSRKTEGMGLISASLSIVISQYEQIRTLGQYTSGRDVLHLCQVARASRIGLIEHSSH